MEVSNTSERVFGPIATAIVNELANHWPPSAKGSAKRRLVKLLDDRLSLMFKDITEFHEKFELGYDGNPRHLPADLSFFRIKFMEEELDEYKTAVLDHDMHGQFDALIDLVYVALGTALLQGFPFGAGWERVHQANMKKVRTKTAGDSKRNSTYDVIKPPGWKAPHLGDLLISNGKKDT